MAWFNFNNFYGSFITVLTLLVLCFIVICFSVYFLLYRNKSNNQANVSAFSSIKFSNSNLSCFNNSFKYSCNNKFKRFYSNKASSLKESEFSLQQESPENSNQELNLEDLKALHSLYIKDLYKDRLAPVVPFDSNLILASCNLSDVKDKSEFLKE